MTTTSGIKDEKLFFFVFVFYFSKELSRKAVLEQQEENKIRMEKVLEDQQAKFQDFLQDQASCLFRPNN